MSKTKVILIFGPTGVSKTDLSIRLAENMGEIISADSMQIYRGMDIGTAKVSQEERNTVAHHLIDIVDPETHYTANHFYKDALRLIQEINQRGKLPFVVGGTGLYFKALIHGLFEGPERDDDLRSSLEDLSRRSDDYLHQKLKTVDPKGAMKIHQNDKKRLIRALEVYQLTGKPISDHWEDQLETERFDFLNIGLTLDRAELYQRIDERCDKMIDLGLIKEVEALKMRGCTPDLPSMKGIGYRHFIPYLNKELGLDECIRLFKRDTRRFAKRQWTLFLRIDNTHWYRPGDFSGIRDHIHRFLSEPGGTL